MVNFEELNRFDLGQRLLISERDLHDFDEILCSDDVIVIIKRYSHLEDFSNTWKETVHFTAGYIQNQLEQMGFSSVVAWDIYIIFLVNFDVNLNVVCEIEKDKFCCKKYVVDVRHYINEKTAILANIPLFAVLDFNLDDSLNNFNDADLKTKIIQSHNNHVANSFSRIDFIDDSSKCESLLRSLKELYINE